MQQEHIHEVRPEPLQDGFPAQVIVRGKPALVEPDPALGLQPDRSRSPGVAASTSPKTVPDLPLRYVSTGVTADALKSLPQERVLEVTVENPQADLAVRTFQVKLARPHIRPVVILRGLLH
ncbi:hypothetical protein ABIB27_002920 [Arthrobacter sp. UYEF21]